jgi:Tfp pilus assembly protein PilW
MECKVTSIKRSVAGETLSSTIIGLCIAVLLLGATGVVYISMSRSFASLADLLDLDSSSRMALDIMSKDIRQADRLTSYSATALTFQSGSGEIAYQWNSDLKTLTRRLGAGPAKTILRDCQSVRYDIFQRNLTNGSYDYYPAAVTAPTNTKVVQVTLACSRSVLGRSSGSSGFQSAKIVIRKQK